MSTLLNDDELVAAVRGITVSDPLPDVDPVALAARGGRGLRRRRALSMAGLGVVAAAVAVAAGAVPIALGGDRPEPAGPPVTASTPSAPSTPIVTPSGDAALLGQCGTQVRTDLTGWRIAAKDVELGYLTVVLAVDPAGRHSATCHLPGPKLPFGIPSSWNAVGQVTPPPAEVGYVETRIGRIPRHMFEQGTETCPGPTLSKCVGFLFYETGRLPLKAARIHAVAANGRATDIPVVNGWFAVSWGDRNPEGMTPVTWTVYDAHGKVLGSNR